LVGCGQAIVNRQGSGSLVGRGEDGSCSPEKEKSYETGSAEKILCTVGFNDLHI